MEPKRLAEWIYCAGGRRFLMTVGAGVVNTGLFVCKCLSESGYINLTMATVGSYLAANTIEGWKNGKEKKDDPDAGK